jgi:hypothetical protein
MCTTEEWTFGPTASVPSMFDSSGCKSRSNLVEVKDSRTQGRCREARSERRARQRRGPMNKNRIRGARRRASGLATAKPISIKDVSVDPAVVRRQQSKLPREICRVSPPRAPKGKGRGTTSDVRTIDRTAEVSREHSSREIRGTTPGDDSPAGSPSVTDGVATRPRPRRLERCRVSAGPSRAQTGKETCRQMSEARQNQQAGGDPGSTPDPRPRLGGKTTRPC